jgi:hypothetical protein
MMHDLARSPHGATYLLTHPRMNESENFIIDHANQEAERHGEPRLHFQALEVLPTFHADYHKFFFAGGNCIKELRVVKYGKTKEGKKTITLELPSWWK